MTRRQDFSSMMIWTVWVAFATITIFQTSYCKTSTPTTPDTTAADTTAAATAAPASTTSIPPRHVCNALQGMCAANSTCKNNTQSGLMWCKCDSGFYEDREKTTCKQRVKVGSHCEIEHSEEEMCVDGAKCDQHNLACACLPTHYEEPTTNTCTERKNVTMACTVTSQCVDHAECVDHSGSKTCQCGEHFYENQGTCQQKIAVGDSCASNNSCVDNAHCDGPSNKCICNSDTNYNLNGTCRRRQHIGGQCDEKVLNECLVNGVCVHSRCECDTRSYPVSPSGPPGVNDTCQTTLKVNVSCNMYNNDPKQCESDTKCVFRAWDVQPVCGCDAEHFFNGEICERRGRAGDPCPYDVSRDHQNRLEILNQCVENAKCNPTYLICECDVHHFQRGGHCPPRINADGACDPWANYYQQCVDDYECYHGRCIDSSTVRQLIG